jgi:glycosyltransferase involved in cell wall biosynthesis
MRILHVTDAGTAVPGGRETHISAFSFVASQLGNSASTTTVDELPDAPPDVILLHSREAWVNAAQIRQQFPSSRILAWVHDQSFVCAASISWFRKTRQECWLPLGAYCFTNAYTLHCNARRPDRNLANCLSVRSSLGGIPALDGIIVASEYMKKRMISGGAPADIIHVLPYFVNAPDSQSIRHTPHTRRRLLYIGRLNETKGVDVLIDAMGHLPDDVELVIAGDGYVIGDLKRKASEYDHPAGRITFSGHLADRGAVERAYLSADVLAVPSLWPEPFGIVGLEAMMYGVPVVASRVGGIPEWLQDGITGYLSEPGNSLDLAEKLLAILRDSKLASEMGSNARRLVRSSYSWEQHWKGFTDIVNRSSRN